MFPSVVVLLLVLVAVTLQKTQAAREPQYCQLHDLQALNVNLRKLKTDFHEYKEAMEADSKIDEQATDIAALKDALVAAQANITALQDSLATAYTKIDQQAINITKLQDSLTAAETELTNLKTSLTGASTKPNVVFHARNIGEQPIQGDIIKFLKIVKNVGGGYNITSGCFTAPVTGVYTFSAQVCTHPKKYIYLGIYIRRLLSNKVLVYDIDHTFCGSLTAVSVLEVGDDVCIRSSSGQSTDPVWNYNYVNYFMGAIIN